MTNRILAFAFGSIFAAVLLLFVYFIPHPTNQQFEVVRIVLALAAGGVAAIVPGFLNLKIGNGANLALGAGGALAVFVVVYFYSPARWASSDQTGADITVTTKGNNSPAINGNGNTVNAP